MSILNCQFISNCSMKNVQSCESTGRKSVQSGIKTYACLLAAELVAFKIDHSGLQKDPFSIPFSIYHEFSRTHYKLVRLGYAITSTLLTFSGFVK